MACSRTPAWEGQCAENAVPEGKGISRRARLRITVSVRGVRCHSDALQKDCHFCCLVLLTLAAEWVNNCQQWLSFRL